jgi:predicted nucleic acid-binding protein
MIFVDSSAWIALLDSRDGFHQEASAFQRVLGRGVHGRLVTTDYVLDESVTYLRLRAGPEEIRRFREVLSTSESLQVVWTSPDRFWAAWEMLEKRPDNQWSLTDCLSFITMTSLGIRSAFGFDSDFLQAGFVLLPSEE